MLVLIVVMTAGADAVFVVVMVMLFLLVQGGGIQQCLMAVHVHDLVDLLAGQLVPRRGNDVDIFAGVLSDQSERLVQTLLVQLLRAAEHDCARALELVVVKLTEVLDIHTALGCVGDSGHASHLDLALLEHRTDRRGDIRQLADARRLDQDMLRGELRQHVAQRLGKVADQRTADTAGIHLGDLDAGVLEEAAVNADFAELVLDQDNLLALERTLQQLADEGRLTGAEEAGDNINFCHCSNTSNIVRYSSGIMVHQLPVEIKRTGGWNRGKRGKVLEKFTNSVRLLPLVLFGVASYSVRLNTTRSITAVYTVR